MLWSCLECTTRYALDLQACPHCGSADREEAMPKITRLGGPSDARAVQSPVDEVAPDEGSEPSSPGISSSASPRKTASTSKKSAASRRVRARTTESLSSLGREANSSVSGATTAGPATVESSDEA